MQIDERMVVKGLVSSQINGLKSRVNQIIDDFYDSFNPVQSLNRSVITDLITDLNDFFYTIGGTHD